MQVWCADRLRRIAKMYNLCPDWSICCTHQLWLNHGKPKQASLAIREPYLSSHDKAVWFIHRLRHWKHDMHWGSVHLFCCLWGLCKCVHACVMSECKHKLWHTCVHIKVYFYVFPPVVFVSALCVCVCECVWVLPITPAINTRSPSVTEFLGGCSDAIIGFRWSPRSFSLCCSTITPPVWERKPQGRAGGERKKKDEWQEWINTEWAQE